MQRDVERARKRHQPRACEAAEEEEPEAGAGALAEQRRRERDGDQRLNLLEDDRRHRVALHERFREQDRRECGRPCADDDSCRHVPRSRAPQSRQGDHDHRQEEQDEEDVLAEDDRRCLGGLRERPTQERVHAP